MSKKATEKDVSVWINSLGVMELTVWYHAAAAGKQGLHAKLHQAGRAGNCENVVRTYHGLSFWLFSRRSARPRTLPGAHGSHSCGFMAGRDDTCDLYGGQPIIDEMMGFFTNFIVRGQELGLVRDDVPLDLIIALFASFDVATDKWFADRWDDFEPSTLEAYADTSLRMLARMLAPE